MTSRIRLCISVLALAAVTAIGVVTVAAEIAPEQTPYETCNCRDPSGRSGYGVYNTDLGREQCSPGCAIDTGY